VPPDFLNSREDAILVWTAVILAYALYRNPRGIGSSFLEVVRTTLDPKLLSLFGSLAVYSGLLLYGAKEIGLWHAGGSGIKATVYWFVGIGVVLVGEAVMRARPDDAYLLRRVFKRVVGVTIVIEFIVNVYALPLAYELVLVLAGVLFAGMQVVVQHDASADPRARMLIDGVIAAIGGLYLVYVLVRVIGDLDGFLTRGSAEDFLVGPALTLALIPFLYSLAWASRREQENLRKRFWSASNSPV
jgi:hypothetical protein